MWTLVTLRAAGFAEAGAEACARMERSFHNVDYWTAGR